MANFKRQQQKYVKKPYRVRNWAEYEKGLRSRGSLTVWIALDTAAGGTIPGWGPPAYAEKKRGRQSKDSKMAIATCLRIRAVYHQPLRQTEGFLKSLFALLNRGCRCARPHHRLAAQCQAPKGTSRQP